MTWRRLVWGCGCWIAACAGPAEPPAKLREQPLSARVARVVVEVDAQLGADPLFDEVLPGVAAWSVVEDNLQRLFPGRALELPGGPDEVGYLPASAAGQAWSDGMLLQLANDYQDTPTSEDTQLFHVLFVRGSHQDAERSLPLGASLDGYNVIVMFTDHLTLSGNAVAVQEVTLVHEFGHAIGLVDGAVPAQTPHGVEGHCTHPECVMFEGLSAQQASRRLQDAEPDSRVLFGSACLADRRGLRLRQPASRLAAPGTPVPGLPPTAEGSSWSAAESRRPDAVRGRT